jgi:hypothetical protein
MEGKRWSYGEKGKVKMENGKRGEMRLTQRTLRAQSALRKRGRRSGKAWGGVDQDLGGDLGVGDGEGDG